MKTICLMLFVFVSLNMSQTFQATSSTLVTDKNSPGLDMGATPMFKISARAVKIYHEDGTLWRTFYPASGYTFGFRDWACPAIYDDYEQASILLHRGSSSFENVIIINYPNLGTSMVYEGYYK